MPYTLKSDTTVICQCGAVVSKYYMQKHLQTAKHERDMVGREHIEVVDHYKYKPRNNSYIYIYKCKKNLDMYFTKKKLAVLYIIM